ERAKRDGIELKIDSGFRDFGHQLELWNARARGGRPIRDRRGTALEHAMLKPAEIAEAIMNWLAVPGSSRHHWGTDPDTYDGKRPRPTFVRPEAQPGGAWHD